MSKYKVGKVRYSETVDGWMYSKAEEGSRVCRCCGDRKMDDQFYTFKSHACRECNEWAKNNEEN